MQARSLDDCLSADSGFARLAGHAARLLRLQRIFESAAPAPLARSARVANFKLGKLVIHAENGAVAAKIRQIIPTLFDVFRNEVAEVTGIQVSVQPRQTVGYSAPAATHQPLGEHAREELKALADRLPADSPLSRSLRRLVDHS